MCNNSTIETTHSRSWGTWSDVLCNKRVPTNAWVWYCISIYNATSMPMIWHCNAISSCKGSMDNCNWKRLLVTVVGIGVVAAVTATVILIVRSALSTQNGWCSCLSNYICFNMVLYWSLIFYVDLCAVRMYFRNNWNPTIGLVSSWMY